MAAPPISAAAALDIITKIRDRDIRQVAENATFREYVVKFADVKRYTSFRSGQELLDHLPTSVDSADQAPADACSDSIPLNAWNGSFPLDALTNTLHLGKELLDRARARPARTDQALSGICRLTLFFNGGFLTELRSSSRAEEMKQVVELMSQHRRDPSNITVEVLTAGWEALAVARLSGEGAGLLGELGVSCGVVFPQHDHGERMDKLLVSTGLPVWLRWKQEVEEKLRLPVRAYDWLERCMADDPTLYILLLDAGMMTQLMNDMEALATDTFDHFMKPFTIFKVICALLAKTGSIHEIQERFPQSLKLVAQACTHSPDRKSDEQLATMLAFISMKTAMPLELDGAEGEQPRFQALVKRAREVKYSWFAFAKDTLLPSQDLILDLVGLFSYIHEGQFQFLGIILLSMLFNGVCTTWAGYSQGNHATWMLVLNFCSFGLFFMLRESAQCSDTGIKTVFLRDLKMFEACESYASLFVGTYSMLIVGYVPGYHSLKRSSKLARLLSIASSLVTLPMAAADSVYADATDDNAKGIDRYQKNLKSSAKCCGFTVPMGFVALFAFQMCDIHSQLVLLLFQLAFRPAGIFVVLAVQLFLWEAIVWCKLHSSDIASAETSVLGLLCLAFTPGCHPEEMRLVSKVTAFLRLFVVTVAWATVLWQGSTDAELAEHLHLRLNKVFVAVAAAGSLGLPLTLAQQWRAGRFVAEHQSYQLLPIQTP